MIVANESPVVRWVTAAPVFVVLVIIAIIVVDGVLAPFVATLVNDDATALGVLWAGTKCAFLVNIAVLTIWSYLRTVFTHPGRVPDFLLHHVPTNPRWFDEHFDDTAPSPGVRGPEPATVETFLDRSQRAPPEEEAHEADRLLGGADVPPRPEGFATGAPTLASAAASSSSALDATVRMGLATPQPTAYDFVLPIPYPALARREGRLVEDVLGYRHCARCHEVKPERAHHCAVAGVCVLKMDHFCPWVGNTVGYRNYKFFLQFVFYAWIGCTAVMLGGFDSFLGSLFSPKSKYQPQPSLLFVPLVCFLFAFSFSIALTLFVFAHGFFVARNRTTVEAHEVGRNPYDLGVRDNFEQVFGLSWKSILLPVDADEVNVATVFGTFFRRSVRDVVASGEVRRWAEFRDTQRLRASPSLPRFAPSHASPERAHLRRPRFRGSATEPWPWARAPLGWLPIPRSWLAEQDEGTEFFEAAWLENGSA